MSKTTKEQQINKTANDKGVDSQAVVRRKIVQITCHINFVVFALCNDGTVWELVLSDGNPSKWGKWKKLPKMPA